MVYYSGGVYDMYTFLFPEGFWVKMLIFLVVTLVSIILFNAMMRKVLNVERRKFFSYNFVNDLHKKGEWTIRIIFIITLIVIGVVYQNNLFISITLLALAISLTVFRAIIEKKYAQNHKAYLYTLSEMGFALVSSFTMGYILFAELF